MTFFKTNFNMPVEDVFGDVTTQTQTDGMLDYINEATSYSLTGFVPGYEVCVGTAVWLFDNTTGSGTYNVNTGLYSNWRDSSLNVLVAGLNNWNYTATIPVGYWSYQVHSLNIGVASWEISSSATYKFRSQAAGTPNISLNNTDVTITNCPSVSTTGNIGYIWVEGSDLCFINANNFKHTMVGTDGGSNVGTAGYIWIDSSNYLLNWIGSNGHKFTAKWKVKQFASVFSNGPTGATYAGTSYSGTLWLDDEFGYTHLAYIAPDGYKYLTGAGDDPYA